MADILLAIYLYVVAPIILVLCVGGVGVVIAALLAPFVGTFNAGGDRGAPMDW